MTAIDHRFEESCAPPHNPIVWPFTRRRSPPDAWLTEPPACASDPAGGEPSPAPAIPLRGLSEKAAIFTAGAGDFSATPNTALPGTAPGGSISSVLTRRMAHIQAGHTPEKDLALRDNALPLRAREELRFALEDLWECPTQNAATGLRVVAEKRHKNLLRARHKLVKAAAYLLAAIDCIDLKLEQEGREP